MGVLKKVKASSIVETLVATVIIVILFAIASLTLNTMFIASAKGNTDAIETQLRILEYKYINGQIETPYFDDFKDWELSVEMEKGRDRNVLFQANHKKRIQRVSKNRIHAID